MKLTCALLLFLVVAGCGCKDCGKKDEAAPDAVARLDDRHTLTAPVTVGNLTVWPVVTDKPLDLGEFLTLDEALAKGSAEVREVGAAGAAQTAQVEGQAPSALQEAEAETAQTLVQTAGTGEMQVLGGEGAAVVSTLVIENKGDLPILVCAGTVVKGGNQDRQIGQDFVLKAKTTTDVDAFCVEQGRWQTGRMGVDTGGKFEVLDGMATAKVRAKGQYEKDQGGVWQEVADVRSGMAVQLAGSAAETGVTRLNHLAISGDSSSFAVAFDANASASAEDLKRVEESVKKHFAGEPKAVGFAYAINGKPVTVRTFAHPRLLGKQLDDFVRGMATESLLAKPDGAAKPATAADVVALVKSISAAEEQVAETKGLNRNGIRENAAGYNGNCYLAESDGRLTPLTQDWTAK